MERERYKGKFMKKGEKGRRTASIAWARRLKFRTEIGDGAVGQRLAVNNNAEADFRTHEQV